MLKASARGFTLIELVVVITILGILAAFAVPRFLSLDTQARVAAVQGLAGSVRSAAALARSMHLVNNGTVVIDGVTITTTNGYPDINATTGIIATLQDTTGFDVSTPGLFQKTGATTPADCSVEYEPAALNSSPQITVVTTGC